MGRNSQRNTCDFVFQLLKPVQSLIVFNWHTSDELKPLAVFLADWAHSEVTNPVEAKPSDS